LGTSKNTPPPPPPPPPTGHIVIRGEKGIKLKNSFLLGGKKIFFFG